MKTKEEFNAKYAELNEENMEQVSGGSMKQKILPNELDIDDFERYKLFIG